uniref:Ig-like domain-containing protein n=1 Tax=Caenorhabditis japonica TaxID=281687 RepID=A0A8R1E1V1_CAEJA
MSRNDSKCCGGGVSRQLRRCLTSKCSGESVRFKVCAQKACESRARLARDTVCGGEEIVSRGQIVGCDGLVGSSFRFDACGVCGGRGDTCENGKFIWKVSEEYTACASNCDDVVDWSGAGRSIASHSQPIVVCVNAVSGRVVPERLCADKLRPQVESRPCPMLICPSRWMAADWTECVPHCGPGIRRRDVYCVQSAHNVTVHVADTFCENNTRPAGEENCISTSCGRWEAGKWSRCTVSCGQGFRRRHVACVGGSDCDDLGRPRQETTCYAGIPCSMLATNSLDWNDRAYLDGNTFGSMDSNDWQAPRLVTGEWSACSSTCGTGVMSRTVECVAVNPISSAPIKLPMSECQDQEQPKLFESCEVRSCPLQEDAKLSEDEAPHQWRYGDWTQCSASCLGGKQKAALKCIQVSTGKSVQWSQCDARRRPPEKSRLCNQHPCPPFWLTSPYSECSASCGTGTLRRTAKCAQTVSKTDGSDAHIILRDDKCLLKKPQETDVCNVVACPATWVTAQWTECSRSCDSGERRRQVWCEIKDARGKTLRRPDVECDPLTKPLSVEVCSFGSCSRPELLTNRVFEQNAEQKKLTLGIGGVATLYQGTSIKIKCPAKKFDKKKIYWKKNGKKIRNDAHIKVSANGNLRVFHARMEDAGVYECFTDRLQGNVTLNFKYRDFPASRDISFNRLPNRKGQKLKSQQPPQKSTEDTIREQGSVLHKLNTSIIEALLNAPNDEKAREQLRNYGNKLVARWDIGHWSECRQKTCHVAGYQARSLSCKVTFHGETRSVDPSICESLASVRPPETRPCHRQDCPRWEASQWSDCSSQRCVSSMLAQKKRNVTCRYTNGTSIDILHCDITNRPATTMDCPNQNCKAEWRTSDWGSCSSECGTGGVQLRLLSCVWISSGRPAGRNCEQMRRPHSARACVADEPLPPCMPTASALFQRGMGV